MFIFVLKIKTFLSTLSSISSSYLSPFWAGPKAVVQVFTWRSKSGHCANEPFSLQQRQELTRKATRLFRVGFLRRIFPFWSTTFWFLTERLQESATPINGFPKQKNPIWNTYRKTFCANSGPQFVTWYICRFLAFKSSNLPKILNNNNVFWVQVKVARIWLLKT